jgi:AcrR family transcriptional regulator
MSLNTEDKKKQLIEQRKEQILTAAKHTFAQNGYRRTKIDQIADYLNVGKGTLYRYFTNKKSLFLAVFEQGVNKLLKIIKETVLPITDPRLRLATAVRTYFEFFEKDRELIEIIMQVRSEFKDDYRRVFLASYSEYIVKIQENLRNGVSTGIFREMDVEKTAEAISGTLQGVLQSFYVREFGPETQISKTQEDSLSNNTTTGANNMRSVSKQKKETLTDRIEAITNLFLEGLLKREYEKSV